MIRKQYHGMNQPRSPQRPQSTHRSQRNSYRSHHRIIKLILLIIVIVGVFYLVEGLRSSHTFNKDSYTQPNQSTTAESRISHHQPVSVLMMGTDTGALGRHYKGRTDTMIINAINPGKQTMSLTSIPRDTPAHYNGMLEKINAVYTFGGANQAAHYVQSWLGVPINYYMLINMGGMSKIIDKVGGVTVTPQLSFNYGGSTFKKNQPIKLDGKTALNYCRMRHQDPRGDYGRQARQRQVLFQLFDKLTKLHTLAIHPSVARDLSHNMKTNLSIKDLMTLALYYRKANDHQVSSHLQGHTNQINGQDFEVVSPSEKAKEAQLINSNLN